MKNNGSFWDLLQNCINSGYLLAASSNGESDTVETELGIVEGHAYAVLDAQELNGGSTNKSPVIRGVILNGKENGLILISSIGQKVIKEESKPSKRLKVEIHLK